MRGFSRFGKRIAIFNQLQLDNGVRVLDGHGGPTSGLTGTGVSDGNAPAKGSLYVDHTNGAVYVNESSSASQVYWSPIRVPQPGVVGVQTDFSRSAGLAGTSTAATYNDDGVRYFGQGIETNDADTDIVVSYPVLGPLLTVNVTNETNHIEALGFGGATALWNPGTYGPLVIDVNFTSITDILARSFFVGFNGEVADAMNPCVTSDTITHTFEAAGTTGDNVHGLVMDSRLTDADVLSLVTNKANAAATQTVADSALTVASNMPAAATYVRLRVEIDAAGNLRAFVNKAEVKKVLLAVSTTVKLSPAFYISTTENVTKSMAVRNFAAYAVRP